MAHNVYPQKDINGKKFPSGDVEIDGDLVVTGGVNIGGDLAVTGTASAANVSASTALSTGGTFTATGASIFNGAVTLNGAFTATTGLNKFLVPGVYANDAAAAAAGIPVGGLYRVAAGVLAWRQV